MVFLDTSAIFALADNADPNHDVATEVMAKLVSRGEPILLHNYVLVEAAALLQRRIVLASALGFLKHAHELETYWIQPEDHQAAVELLEARSRRGLGLVDCASFVVMRRYDVTHAFAFDTDFETEGFQLYEG